MSSTNPNPSPLSLLKTVETIQTTIKDLQKNLDNKDNKDNITKIQSKLKDIKSIDEILKKIIILWTKDGNQWKSGLKTSTKKPKYFI